MTDLSYLNNFKGVKPVFSSERLVLYRAVDLAVGAVRWVYQAMRPVASPENFRADVFSKFKQSSHHNDLPILEVGLDPKGRPFMVVEHTSGVPLVEMISSGSLSETQLLCSLLHILRVFKLSQLHAGQPVALDPAFIFLANEANPQADTPISATHMVLLDSYLAQMFAVQDTTDVVGPKWLAREFAQLGKRCLDEGARNSQLWSWLAKHSLAEGDLSWRDLELNIVTALAGRHIVDCVPLELECFLSEQQKRWQLMDCQAWGNTGWFRCMLFDKLANRWQRAWVLQLDEADSKARLKKWLGLAGVPGLYQLQDAWFFGSRVAPWVCLLDEYDDGHLLSDAKLPLPLNKARQIMADLCRQQDILDGFGLSVIDVKPEQVFQTQSVPLLLPIAAKGPTSQLSTSDLNTNSISANLAALAVRLITGRLPRWYNGELQFGTRFDALPDDVRRLLRQCLRSVQNNGVDKTISFSVMADIFSSNSPVPKAPEAKQARRRKPVKKAEHRKKLLLLLLLVLLFQSMVNVGIIVVYQ